MNEQTPARMLHGTVVGQEKDGGADPGRTQKNRSDVMLREGSWPQKAPRCRVHLRQPAAKLPGAGGSTERERRRGREMQGKEEQVAPSWVSFHSEENVPKLIAGMVTQPCGLHNPVKGVNLHN